MTERIEKLVELTLKGKMFATPNITEFDKNDLFLSRNIRETKRLCEYILNQKPVLYPESKMTGFFNFDGSVVGDIFSRTGHKNTNEVMNNFYLKISDDNLQCMEWQHAAANYSFVLQRGINGILDKIDNSIKKHTSGEKIEFLNCLKQIAETLIVWAKKCSNAASELSKTVTSPEYKDNLKQLSKALLNVPANKPSSFYEAVLMIYIIYAADPDSVGTLDRYLEPFYKKDMQSGIITRETAGEYLQELFIMLQAKTHIDSCNFTRGGESHFCIGGYLPDGSECFSDLSRLILESLIDLPFYAPQVTLRWTKKTPREVFRFALDCERNDPYKRIAFQNDEKRIKCYTEICSIPYETAVGYTVVGCNEPTFGGSIQGGTTVFNFARSMETVFHKRANEITDAQTFEDFYAVFKNEMLGDITRVADIDDKYNACRASDTNYLSSLFFNGCIEKAESATKGVSDYGFASLTYIGIPNVIDSLIVVKQFVFDDKAVTMKYLISALQNDWVGYEDLRALIIKKGDFFGNDTERSNAVTQMLYSDIYEFLKGKTNIFGYPLLVGDLIGYNPHHAWFGSKMKATPDGRKNGDMLKFGLGQSEGKDREGLTALLNSVAKADPTGIGCGSTITNINLDEQLVKNDDNFEKTVDMFESYFKNGGVHFQLNYVSREDLLNAKKRPEDYQNLRVRVSGFSDYFVRLTEGIQDDIIKRTSQK